MPLREPVPRRTRRRPIASLPQEWLRSQIATCAVGGVCRFASRCRVERAGGQSLRCRRNGCDHRSPLDSRLGSYFGRFNDRPMSPGMVVPAGSSASAGEEPDLTAGSEATLGDSTTVRCPPAWLSQPGVPLRPGRDVAASCERGIGQAQAQHVGEAQAVPPCARASDQTASDVAASCERGIGQAQAQHVGEAQAVPPCARASDQAGGTGGLLLGQDGMTG